MYSPLRAMFRRFALIHFVVFVPLFLFGYYAQHVSLDSTKLWILGVMHVPLVLLVIDTIVVIVLLRRIQPVVTVKIAQEALLYGITWRWLYTQVRKAKSVVSARKSLERDLPELKRDAAYLVAVEDRNWMGASIIIDRALRRRVQDQKRAQQEERKQARSEAKLDALASEARSLGIEEVEIGKARAHGTPALRDLIFRHNERETLLCDAMDQGYLEPIKQILESQGIGAAKMALSEVGSMLLEASEYGIRNEVRQCIFAGDLKRATKLIEVAERKNRWAVEREALEKRINAKPQPIRAGLMRTLGELEAFVYDSRDFRIKRHELETALNP